MGLRVPELLFPVFTYYTLVLRLLGASSLSPVTSNWSYRFAGREKLVLSLKSDLQSACVESPDQNHTGHQRLGRSQDTGFLSSCKQLGACYQSSSLFFANISLSGNMVAESRLA